MAGSIKLCEVRGIGVYVHVTFFVLLLWAGLSAWGEQQTVEAVAGEIGLLLAVFCIVVLHELGHATAAQRFGVTTRDITLLPIGGIARMDRIPAVPSQELVIALAGPAVNVLLAAAIFAGLSASGNLGPINENTIAKGPFLERLMLINVSLALFNLLPAFPLDGGRALRALLATRISYPRATRAAARAGQAISILLFLTGLLGNPMLVFIAMFVWIGGEIEARMAEVTMALGSVPARRAMLTDFQTLPPGAPLARAVELVLAGSQRQFPVTEDGRVVGLLTSSALMDALAKTPSATVGDIMCREVHPAEPEDMLGQLITRLDEEPGNAIPIVHENRLLGMLTSENLAEFLIIQQALERRLAGKQGAHP